MVSTPGASQGTLLPQLEGGRVVDPERAGIVWRKSSFSESGNCVEVGGRVPSSGEVRLRHSQTPAGIVLTFTREAWTMFVADVRRGKFGPGGGPSATA